MKKIITDHITKLIPSYRFRT